MKKHPLKPLCIIIAFTLIFVTFTVTASARTAEPATDPMATPVPVSMLGDVNLDGKITAKDARLALRASAKLETLNVTQFRAADLNNDGRIAANEARLILRVSAKLDEFRPGPQGLRIPFDFEEIMTGSHGLYTTAIFSGTVESIRTVRSSWTDEKGENWGPYTRTIIDVALDEPFAAVFGKQTLRVLYGTTLHPSEKCTIWLERGRSYFFLNCWVLDEKYRAQTDGKIGSPLLDPALQQADVAMGGTWNSLMIPDGDRIIMLRGYAEGFFGEETAAGLPIADHELLTTAGWKDYVSVDRELFDSAIKPYLG